MYVDDQSLLGRSDHTLTLVRGSLVYVFGGKQRGNAHGGDSVPLNDIRILDFRSSAKRLKWRKALVTGYVPSRRWGHEACCIDGTLYIFGGIAAASPFTRMDPYLDDSHQTSIPKRPRKALGAKSDDEEDELLAGLPAHLRQVGVKKKRKAPPKLRKDAFLALIGAFNIDTSTWKVPAIMSHDVPGAPDTSFLSQRRAEGDTPPYALVGHTATVVESWQGGSGDMRSSDVVIFGGWRWMKHVGPTGAEIIRGPILSDDLRIVRVADRHVDSALSNTVSWAGIQEDDSRKGPGQDATMQQSHTHSGSLSLAGVASEVATLSQAATRMSSSRLRT